eukprot:215419-Chlamydomonas_euryale.AAC.3
MLCHEPCMLGRLLWPEDKASYFANTQDPQHVSMQRVIFIGPCTYFHTAHTSMHFGPAVVRVEVFVCDLNAPNKQPGHAAELDSNEHKRQGISAVLHAHGPGFTSEDARYYTSYLQTSTAACNNDQEHNHVKLEVLIETQGDTVDC